MKKLMAVFMALALCMTSGCSACGQQRVQSTTMHLVKALGEVSVVDAKEKSLSVIENLGLYNGYSVSTGQESYAWIDLDDVKLTKMDKESMISIEQSGRKLEIYLECGSLFFNVTRSLEADETMNIRTSNMVMGIRGTKGWVYTDGENLMTVCLLKGTVECLIYDEDGNVVASQMIGQGQTARMIYDGANSSITVDQITEVPDFVADELEENELAEAISEQENAAGPAAQNQDDSNETNPANTNKVKQKYIVYEEMEPLTMAAKQRRNALMDYNYTEGYIKGFGFIEKGTELTVDARGEYNGMEYYRISRDVESLFSHEDFCYIVCADVFTEPDSQMAAADEQDEWGYPIIQIGDDGWPLNPGRTAGGSPDDEEWEDRKSFLESLNHTPQDLIDDINSFRKRNWEEKDKEKKYIARKTAELEEQAAAEWAAVMEEFNSYPKVGADAPAGVPSDAAVMTDARGYTYYKWYSEDRSKKYAYWEGDIYTGRGSLGKSVGNTMIIVYFPATENYEGYGYPLEGGGYVMYDPTWTQEDWDYQKSHHLHIG